MRSNEPSGHWLGTWASSKPTGARSRHPARACVLLLTLRGTPTIYQGEEIGMSDVSIPPELVQDPWEKNVPGLGLGRDPVRTPIPWSQERNSGFTEGKPWLPVENGTTGLNVAAQSQDPTSLLSFYRAILRLRRAELALAAGDIAIVEASEAILAYERRHNGRRLLVALNFRSEAATMPLAKAGRILLSSYPDQTRVLREGSRLELRPNEGVVFELA